MTRIRRLAIAAGLAVPVAGSTIFVLAGPAAADAGISSPGSNAVVSGSSVTVRAHTERDGQLFVDGRMVKSGKGNLSHTIDTHAVRNGSHAVELKQRGILLGALGYWHVDSKKFTVRAAPYAPSGVQASMAGRKVTVKWNRGSEPDLTAYNIESTAGGSKSAPVGSLCSKNSCAATITVPEKASGPLSMSVRARRSDGAGRGAVSSAATTAALAGLDTRNLGAGNASGAFPSLQPLPNQSPFSLPTVGPAGQLPGLQYPEPEPEVAPARQPAAQNVANVSVAQWGKSVAIALILLLAAGHLGMWTRRLRAAHAGSGRGGASGAVLTRAHAVRERASRRAPRPTAEAPTPAEAFGEWTAMATVALSADDSETPQSRTDAPSVEQVAVAPNRPSSRRYRSGHRVPGGYRGRRRRPVD